MGWNSTMWPATTESLWSARSPREWDGIVEDPAGGASPLHTKPFWAFFWTLFGGFSDPFWASHQGGSNIDHQSSPFHFISICNLSLVSSLWALIFIQYLLFIEKYIYRSHLYLTLWLNFRRQPNFHIRDRRLANAGIENQRRNSKSKQE